MLFTENLEYRGVMLDPYWRADIEDAVAETLKAYFSGGLDEAYGTAKAQGSTVSFYINDNPEYDGDEYILLDVFINTTPEANPTGTATIGTAEWHITTWNEIKKSLCGEQNNG